MKRIAILGSTGSIGCQALDIIRQHPDLFEVTVLTALRSGDQLVEQALEFHPEVVVIGNDNLYPQVRDRLEPSGIKVLAGISEVTGIVRDDIYDIVLNAIVGYAGFEPSLCALKEGKILALANKESLVVGGELLTSVAREKGTDILPVDSEHSAIFQCLRGEARGSFRKIILTASGGPFLGYSKEQLAGVSKEEALNHPNWEMGNKITIDSASLMNKGLELIEAKWLFDCQPDQLEVVVHPQSVIHSMVEFRDGSVKAQLSMPDMRMPIIYALGYPDRIHTQIPGIDFSEISELSFQNPDIENFRNLALAFAALRQGGNAPCILNASNEIAVDAFLAGQISFMAIPEVVEHCLDYIGSIREPSFSDYVETDRETRRVAKQFINDWES